MFLPATTQAFFGQKLISAGGGLLYMPMETGYVSTDTIHFIVRVDKKLWVGSGLFKNCNSLFRMQGTVFVGQSDRSIQSQSHIEPHSRKRSSSRDIDI